MELFHIGFLSVRFLDVLDILIVAWLLYKLYRLLKGGVAINILIGIITIYFLWWLFVKVLDMQLLGQVLGQFIGVGVIALIIVFQQELRRFLIFLGTNSIFTKGVIAKHLFSWKFQMPQQNALNINALVKACTGMAKTKTGAIIILTRKSDLKLFEATGDMMDAEISKRLLESIFFKNSPLHDGAVIVADNKIKAARCILPVTESTDIPAHYGMRHRAALGITEQTDAIAIVVSEENGAMAVAVSGTLYSNLTGDELEKKLKNELV